MQSFYAMLKYAHVEFLGTPHQPAFALPVNNKQIIQQKKKKNNKIIRYTPRLKYRYIMQ